MRRLNALLAEGYTIHDALLTNPATRRLLADFFVGWLESVPDIHWTQLAGREVETRLTQQRARIAAEGPEAARPRYSDRHLAALADEANENGLNERFIVRFGKSKYAGDGKTIGPTDPNGNAKYWTAPLSTAEPGDTDPESLARLLGVDYDPNADYTVTFVDLETSNLRDEARTFVPTHRNMARFAKGEADELDPKRIDEVMRSNYGEQYRSDRATFKAEGKDIRNPKHIERFGKERFDTEAERKRFRTRAIIESDFGANDRFLGNALTEYKGDGQMAGSLETYTFDRKPRP